MKTRTKFCYWSEIENTTTGASKPRDWYRKCSPVIELNGILFILGKAGVLCVPYKEKK